MLELFYALFVIFGTVLAWALLVKLFVSWFRKRHPEDMEP